MRDIRMRLLEDGGEITEGMYQRAWRGTYSTSIYTVYSTGS